MDLTYIYIYKKDLMYQSDLIYSRATVLLLFVLRPKQSYMKQMEIEQPLHIYRHFNQNIISIFRGQL